MKFKSFFLLLGCSLFCASVSSQELNLLATEFLNTLDPELKSKTVFALDDEERLNFNFIPIVRKGPTFHDFNAAARDDRTPNGDPPCGDRREQDGSPHLG